MKIDFILRTDHFSFGFVLFRFSEEKISVRIYEHDRDTNNETEHVDRKVTRVVGHGSYSEYSFNNDIALLALDKEVPLGGTLRPVCLPPAS